MSHDALTQYSTLRLTGSPFISIPPVESYERDLHPLFCARLAQVSEICGYAVNPMAVFVIAPYGGGKTVTLLESLTELRKQNIFTIYTSFDRAKGFRRSLRDALVSSGCEAGHGGLNELSEIRSMLKNIGREKDRVVVALDDLDRAVDTASVEQVIDDTRDLLTDGNAVIVTGQPFGVTFDLHTSAGGIFHEVVIPEFKANEFAEMLAKYLASVQIEPEANVTHPFEEPAANLICEEIAAACLTPRLFNFTVAEMLHRAVSAGLTTISQEFVVDQWRTLAQRVIRSLRPEQLQHLEIVYEAGTTSEDTPDTLNLLGSSKLAEFPDVRDRILRPLVEENLVQVRMIQGKEQYSVAHVISSSLESLSLLKHNHMTSKTQSTDKSVTWLHLSDAHLRPKSGWDHERVLETLLHDLKERESEDGLSPDLIFFTGDLVFGQVDGEPIVEQFKDGLVFLNEVREVFNDPIAIENVFLVPGNHDVDRQEVTAPLTEWLDSREEVDEITRLIQGKGKSWNQYVSRLRAYRDALREGGLTHLLDDADRLVFAVTREVSGLRIGITGLNSAWSCCRNRENSKLWMGAKWQLGHLARNHKDCDLKIVIVHHPMDWLREEEAPSKLWTQIESDYDFCLHGHEHHGWVKEIGSSHVRVAAGACYERSDHDNGYNFVRLNPVDGSGEVWLRKFDSDGGGWIPQIVMGKTDHDGIWQLAKMTPLSGNP